MSAHVATAPNNVPQFDLLAQVEAQTRTLRKAPTVRLKRKVKLGDKWTFATIAKRGERHLWDYVLVDGEPQKVEGGSFYLEWVELGGRKIQKSIATLDPLLALQAKAELESELKLLFEQSYGFTRQPVDPVILVETQQVATEVFGYVYKVTHKASGRVYIGQTRNMVILRWREHARSAYAGNGARFQQALKEYGAEAFVWETIASGSTQAELDAAESRWIAAHQATDPRFGFNIRA
jgi:hypothetical protein